MNPFKVALVGFEGMVMPDWVPQSLAEAGIDFIARECGTRRELAQWAGDADVVWVFGSRVLTAENLAVMDRCGAIIRGGSGTDNVAVDEATRRGILVANTPEAINESVSDHAVGLMFAVVRQIATQDRLLRSGKWNPKGAWPRQQFRGQVLGLVGFGHVGQLLARKMRNGFEMKVLAHDPFVPAEQMASQQVEAVSLDQLLSQADFVSLHTPLKEDTSHLIGERELQLMKPEAILINTSRGPVVDEPALLKALTEGWIAGAGLDVFETEPVDPDNPLLQLDQVVVTPHIAGFSDQSEQNFWRLSTQTALDLATGRWPRSCVNRDVKPRWNLT